MFSNCGKISLKVCYYLRTFFYLRGKVQHMRFLIILLFIGFQMNAQDLRVRKGVVMDSLKVGDSIEETFSLYIPNSYQENQALPVLFLFDGNGRGKSAAQLFKPAAEAQGYILASSNAIEPGTNILDNVKAATRLIQEVTSTIPIDQQQISVAGFQIGAKVASVIPLLYENIHGVIAVGDHQLNIDLLKRSDDFYFVGIGGTESVSMHEMDFIVNQLNYRGIDGAFISYKGGSEWPHPDIVAHALGLISTEAMRKELQPIKRDLVQRMFEADLQVVDRFTHTGEELAAHDLLSVMELKYDDLVNLSQIRDRRKQLEETQNYKNKRLEHDKLLLEEMRLNAQYLEFFDQDVTTVNYENLGWWNYEVLKLDQMIAGEDTGERAMAQRLKENLRQMGKLALTNIKESDPTLDEKLLVNMMQTIFNQQDYQAYLNVIQLSAVDGDFSTALFYLEELLKNGYSEVETLYNLEGTLGLRLSKDFNGLIYKYLGSARYYTSFFDK